jgi:hypothetical protein
MIIFPSIEPTRREYDLGDFPMEEEVPWPGVGVRFRTGFDPLAVEGLTLTLTFEDLRETQMQQIRTHYNSRQGGTVPFLLPAVIWLGDSDPPAPSGTRWRYLTPPEENQKKGGWFDVTVELEAQGVLATVPPLPVLSIAATSADKDEGDSGSTAFTFTVTRTGDTTGSSSATWTVTGSSADPANAADFTGAAFPTGTVSFAIGETSKMITVNVAGDTTDEPDEGFTVTLSAPSGATLGTATAVGVIRNDDATPGDAVTFAAYMGGAGTLLALNAGSFSAANADEGPIGSMGYTTVTGPELWGFGDFVAIPFTASLVESGPWAVGFWVSAEYTGDVFEGGLFRVNLYSPAPDTYVRISNRDYDGPWLFGVYRGSGYGTEVEFVEPEPSSPCFVSIGWDGTTIHAAIDGVALDVDTGDDTPSVAPQFSSSNLTLTLDAASNTWIDQVGIFTGSCPFVPPFTPPTAPFVTR